VKYDEALTVVELLCNAFPGDRAWGADEIRMYARGIETLDCEHATKAVIVAQSTLERRPPVASFINLYRSTRADSLARERGILPEKTVGARSIPNWVGRWVCARYFYARFGREQDLRRFEEQGEWADPKLDLMPPQEWAEEAKSIRGRDVLRAIGT
jgi:hypothetical protein